ncbi:MAG: hypothetical protein ACRDWI_03790 [Jiangellaceae bacterium]
MLLSTFRRHVVMPVDGAAVGATVAGGPMQAPYSRGSAAVAPDLVAPLLFGPLGIAGLSRRHPDVYPGPDVELMAALFPPVTSDLLTFYLP